MLEVFLDSRFSCLCFEFLFVYKDSFNGESVADDKGLADKLN
jgi:hypothetical protein